MSIDRVELEVGRMRDDFEFSLMPMKALTIATFIISIFTMFILFAMAINIGNLKRELVDEVNGLQQNISSEATPSPQTVYLTCPQSTSGVAHPESN